MALFTMKNVKYTTLLKTNEEFKITGELPFPLYGPMWIDATITFPKRVTDLIGAPTTTKTAIAILGKFSFDFPAPTGFDREGDYSLDLNAYFGPETQVQIGVLSSKNYSIPPFPPVASIATQTFTESGSGPANAVAFQMGDMVVNPDMVVAGQTAVISLPITNIGSQDQTGVTIKMQITETGATPASLPGAIVDTQILGPYTIKAGAIQNVAWNWTSKGANADKWVVVSVLVNGVLSPNTGPTNPNIFKGPTGGHLLTVRPASVSNVSITASPAVATTGQTVVLTINFTTNAVQTLKLSGYVLQAGTGTNSTHEAGSDFTQIISAVAGQNTVTVNLTARDGGVYSGGQSERKVGLDIYDTANNDLYSNTFANVYHEQQGGTVYGNPAITANQFFDMGARVQYSFTGFPPNVQLYMSIQGEGGALDYPGSGDGTGSSAFYLPGDLIAGNNYTLQLTDQNSHTATMVITINSGVVPPPPTTVDSVTVMPINIPYGTAWWECWYVDPVRGMVGGQVTDIANAVLFSGITPGGYIITLYYINGWSDQADSGTFSPTTGSNWNVDLVTGVLTVWQGG